MNIAITGPSGFIGKRLVDHLAGGVHGVTLFDKSKHDLLQPDSLQSFLSGADCVVHLAGANKGNDVQLVTVNTGGTAGLLTGMNMFSPNARMIFASSFQVYVPNSMYALSKKWAEEEVAFFSEQHHIKSVILRFSNVYGPGCTPFYNSVIATYCYQIQRGEEITVHGNGAQKRDYVYVDDIVDAIEKSILYVLQQGYEIVDICSGIPVSLNEIVALLTTLHNGKVKIAHTKTSGTGVEYPQKDFSKARGAFSWKPNTSLKKGLQNTLQHEAEHKKT